VVQGGGMGLLVLWPAVLLSQPGLHFRDAVAIHAGRVQVGETQALLELDPARCDAQMLGEALLGDPGLGGWAFAVAWARRLHWPRLLGRVAMPARVSRLRAAAGSQAWRRRLS
jgi:hypothetical protein